MRILPQCILIPYIEKTVGKLGVDWTLYSTDCRMLLPGAFTAALVCIVNGLFMLAFLAIF